MSGEGHQEPNYMGVFVALIILTAAEIGIFYLHLPQLVMVVSLVLMALAKAGLVAAYFMHLRFEKRTLAIIVLTPLILSAVIIIGLVPDANNRFSYPRKAPTNWVLPGEKGAEESAPAEGGAPGAPGEGQEAPEAPPKDLPPAPAGETPA
ncbi:MAG TPA: cytochrome C oxidase subunit IV family protein [Candidatus Polarisedimenticolia bacterium]|jgi:cytochrome c oxidase subunit 4|nr:cytochrome C oxidase subunit IV family protein [Candidatus Polarisedimenticolia bacterium]